MLSKLQKGEIFASLDIGSSKIVCIIASIYNADIKIIGFSQKAAIGIKGSNITDMKLAQQCILGVISEAENIAGVNIDKILVNISANYKKSFHEIITTKISSDSVRNCDVLSITNKIRKKFIKNNYEIIHLIPLKYKIDDSYPVDNPYYMKGSKLEAQFHIVTVPRIIINNIEECLKKCQISINSYISDCYASSISCLTENEKNLRTLVIDIGSQVTSFCIYSESKLIYLNSVSLGGINITKDISTILNVAFNIAEKLKILNSSLIIRPIEQKELIKVEKHYNISNHISITRSEFKDIIESRLEEIFQSIKAILEQSSIKIDMISGIVITGGTSSIIGIDRIISNIFLKNVRIGYPKRIPSYNSEIFTVSNSCSLGMISFLGNIQIQRKIKKLQSKKSGIIYKTSNIFNNLYNNISR